MAHHRYRPVAPIGRAADSKSACWGFESLLACQFFCHKRCGCSSMVEPQPSKLITWVRFPSPAPYGALAQLGERLLCTQEVSGSIPLSSTIFSATVTVVDFSYQRMRGPYVGPFTLRMFVLHQGLFRARIKGMHPTWIECASNGVPDGSVPFVVGTSNDGLGTYI